MKFLTFVLGRLHNAEHFQFNTEFKDLVEETGPTQLKIEKLFSDYLYLYTKEDDCLLLLQKSDNTGLATEADQRRERTFRGLVNMVKAGTRHFDVDVASAARRLKIVFDGYGKLTTKPNDEETAGIYNLVQDLEGKYADDIEMISAIEWVNQLKSDNEAYEQIIKARDYESSQKPETNMKQIRKKVDRSYRNITQAIEALALLASGAEAERYNGLISQFNVTIKRYKDRLAQRDGMNKAKKAKKESEANTNDN